MANKQQEHRWESRPWLSRSIRFAAFAIPVILSVVSAIVISRWLPEPSSFSQLVLWWVALTTVSTIVLIGFDRLARRLLPIAALYRMSLVFPDLAPSRYRVARGAGGTGTLEQELAAAREMGVNTDRTEAAERILRLVALLNDHDRATRGHSERVRIFSDMLAEELKLTPEDRDKLRWSALLHDVGKVAVHSDVLNKPGRPDQEEWELLKRHPLEGAELTAPLHDWLGEWALAIEQHHEKYDGSGYPYGLREREISWGARIVAVGDAFDTMTAARSYKAAMTAREGRAELARTSGTHFDPQVVRAFLNLGLGRIRLAMGPLSWLAQTPFSGLIDRFGGLIASGSVAAAAGAALVVPGIITIPDITAVDELPPIAAPSPETTDPVVITTEPPPPPPTEPAPTPSPAATELPGEPSPQPIPTPPPPPPVVSGPIGASGRLSPGSGTVTPGQVVDVQVVVSNPGSSTEQATVVVITWPETGQVFLVDGSVTVNGQPLLGDPLTGGLLLPDLAPGENVTVTYQVRISPGAPAGPVAIPAATVSSSIGSAAAGGGTLIVDRTTNLGVVGAAAPTTGGTVVPGDEITYTWTVSNAGAAIAVPGVTFTAPTPADTTFVTGSATIDGGPTATPGNPFSTGLALGDLAPDRTRTVGFRVRVNRPLPDATSISATGRATSPIDGPAAATLTHTTDSTPQPTLALRAAPAAGSAVGPGSDIVYTAVVGNAAGATDTLTAVTFRFVRPTDTTYVAGSAHVDGTPLAGSDPLASPVPLRDLAPGDSVTVQYTARVNRPLPNGTTLTATASADAAQIATPVTRAIDHRVSSAPILTFDLTAQPVEGATVTPGDVITYVGTVTNGAAATATATGVTARLPTPTDTTYVGGSARLDGAPIAGASNPFGSARAVPDLTPGATATFEIQVRVNRPLTNGTPITGAASVDTAQTAPLTDSTVHTVTSSPSLTLAVATTPATTSPATPGETITYVFTVGNDPTATATATGVTFAAPVPTSTTYEPGTARIDGASVTGAYPFRTPYALPRVLAPGDTATVEFQVRVDTPLPDGTPIRLTADVAADQGPGPTLVVDHIVASEVIVSVTTTATPANGTRVDPGSTIRYRTVITNDTTATDTATGITIQHPTHADAPFLGNATVGGSPVASPPNPFATPYALAPLAPGASIAVEFDVEVASPLQAGRVIDTTATVDATQLVAPLTGSTSHTTNGPAIVLTVTPSPAVATPVRPGSSVTYTVTVANTSTAPASSVVLTATTPANTTPSGATDEAGAPLAGNPFAAGYPLPEVPGGGSFTVTYTVTLDPVLPDGTAVAADASVTVFEIPGATTATTTHTVVSNPAMSVAVAPSPASGSSVYPGRLIDYRITVGNTGDEVATGVTLTAPTPTNTTYVPTTATRSDNGGPTVAVPDGPGNPFASSYALGAMAPGETRVLSFQVVVDVTPAGSTVDFTATVDNDRPAFNATASTIHPVVAPPPSDLVISEYRTNGPDGDLDDFVEIYNRGSTTTDIAGYRILISDEESTLRSTTTIPADPADPPGTNLLGPGRHYLLGGPAFSGTADRVLTDEIPQFGGIRLTDRFLTPVDEVGTRARPGGVAGSLFREGVGVPPMPNDDIAQSYERRHGGANGNCIDTDDNAADFIHNMDPLRVTPQGKADPAVACGSPPAPAPTTATSIVISELRTDGPRLDGSGGQDDEFVELFNPTPATVDLSGWEVHTNSRMFTFGPGPVLLAPGQHLLLGHANNATNRYSGPVTPDAWYGSAASASTLGTPDNGEVGNKGFVFIEDAANVIVDAVSLGGGPPGEGRPLPTLEGRTYASYERRDGGTLGSCVDDGDNLSDFHHRFRDDPQNRTSTPTPCPTPPPPVDRDDDLRLTVTADPGPATNVAPNGTITYTAIVRNGANSPRTHTGISFFTDWITPGANAGYVNGSATVNGTGLGAGSNPFGPPTAYALPDLPPGAEHVLTWQGRVAVGTGAGELVLSESGVVTNETAAAMRDRVTHVVGPAPAIDVVVVPNPREGTTVVTGDTITYQVTITNGPAPSVTATLVEFTALLPPGTTYVNDSARVNGAPVLGPNPFTAYPLPDLNPGDSHTVAFSAEVTTSADGVLEFTARVDTIELAGAAEGVASHVTRSGGGGPPFAPFTLVPETFTAAVAFAFAGWARRRRWP